MTLFRSKHSIRLPTSLSRRTAAVPPEHQARKGPFGQRGSDRHRDQRAFPPRPPALSVSTTPDADSCPASSSAPVKCSSRLTADLQKLIGKTPSAKTHRTIKTHAIYDGSGDSPCAHAR